jgi:hypothetical protein
VTVLGYAQPVGVPGTQPQDAGFPAGTVWGALTVRRCAGATAETISQGAWSTVVSGHVVHPAPLRFGTLPGPPFPVVATVLGPGQCLSGTVIFAVLSSSRPARAWYRAGHDDIDWNLRSAG